MDENRQPDSGEYFVSSSATRLDHRTRVLKHADSFAVLDRVGNVEKDAPTEYGLFHQDTRFLSQLCVRMSAEGEAAHPLMLLSSAVKDDDAALYAHLTNPEIKLAGAGCLQQGTLYFLRTQVLWRALLCDRLRIQNYGHSQARLKLHVDFGADFADIFEARGMHRDRRGQTFAPEVEKDAVVLSYQGLDDRLRRTRIVFDRAPASLTGGEAAFDLELPPGAHLDLRWTVSCEAEDAREKAAVASEADAPAQPQWFEQAVQQRRAQMRSAREAEPVLRSSSTRFDEWIGRSLADLQMLATETPHGRYPYAGVPWYSTPFGRDGIVAALQSLWFAPDMSRGVLCYLAATQADRTSDEQDAQPGKILHETRSGEMAATGEVPFARYYGSIDSTPLFLMLGGAYLQRTADLELVRALWPNFERALEWIDRYGDCDGDGFVEYARKSGRGLYNQGWKDSHDSIFHADGRLAEAPIALCEVQGYVFAARRSAASMARALGMQQRADKLEEQAGELRQRFEAAFWCEETGTYALALDAGKNPCRVRTSNAGQVLYTGIASAQHARCVSDTLMSETGFSGWGVRTLAFSEARYNPMSYHDGSVWPHDNSIVAAGLGRYGYREAAAKIMGGLLDASLHFDLHRLPELFCGFARHEGEQPTLYPQACSPQAWSAAAPLLCLQACLGLEVNGAQGQVFFRNPVMPGFLDHIRIDRLRLPCGEVDLLVTRHAAAVAVRALRRVGDVELVVMM